MLWSRTEYRAEQIYKSFQDEWAASAQWEVGEISKALGNIHPLCFPIVLIVENFIIELIDIAWTLYSLILTFLLIMFVNWQLAESEQFSEPQIINVLQDIMEIITQDIMIDGHR